MSKMAGDMQSAQIDVLQLGKDLETQELESASGVPGPQIYGQLLCVYLIQNDVCNAKFLWKRIPAAIKTANTELANIWAVGQKMWLRNFPGIYETLKKEWSEPYKVLMATVLETTRRRAFNLVAQAYSSISSEEFSTYVGMSVNEAIQAAEAEGWGIDQQSKLILPKKPVSAPDPPLPNEQHLSVLTDYVSFLES